MKKTIAKIGIVVLIGITATVFNGCKGKDGATGPAGADGNANVHSMTYNVNASDWALSGVQYYVTLNDPQITTDVINSGAVLVYDNTGGQSLQLPYVWYPSASYSETWYPLLAVGAVQVKIKDSDLTAPGAPGAAVFKVVTMTSRMMLTNPHINFKDYESVRQAFNLK